MEIKRGVTSLNLIAHPIINILLVIGAGMVAGMMLLTACDVALRYIFNRPITGAYEVIAFFMAIVVPFGIAYCGHQGSHVVVDLLVVRLPKKLRAIIGSVTAFLTLGLFILITWQNFIYIQEQYQSKLTSAVLLIPVYPFIGIVAVASAVFCLVLLIDFFKSISEVVEK
ncbi:MAG: TRAP transporter small permease [Syntrophaceae bacterium]|nr:TRAP transporter small permease [Syntrophaceae bacterium]